MTIDFKRVDVNLLNLIQLLNSVENYILMPSIGTLDGTAEFIAAMDSFRGKISALVEQQGSSV